MSNCQSTPCGDPNTTQQWQGLDFTPEQSYQVLWQELNGDPDTSVHQGIDLITDVACSNGEMNESCVP